MTIMEKLRDITQHTPTPEAVSYSCCREAKRLKVCQLILGEGRPKFETWLRGLGNDNGRKCVRVWMTGGFDGVDCEHGGRVDNTWSHTMTVIECVWLCLKGVALVTLIKNKDWSGKSYFEYCDDVLMSFSGLKNMYICFKEKFKKKKK